MTQKKRPTPTNGKPSALDGSIVAEPHGKNKLAKAAPRLSPRQARVLDALRPGHWVDREPLDRIAGSSNGPDVISKLRRKFGQDSIDMELIDGTDRDGKPCRTGRYRLTPAGRERLAQITTSNQQGAA
ncbi:MAG: hypothetical protein RLZ81_750 [Pseudomonadota bacterium]|jgi:hypothetical protein